jgi:outer membrane protein OmpA-like peptidoglycan-associated protein
VARSSAARQDDLPPGEPAAAADFAELRALIVGPEQRQLRTLQTRLDDPATQARDVSRVLPTAMLLRKDDPQMTRALAPTVEEAITASVRRNPRPLADALFPIFGPAIRKAIAASLSGMLESLNQTLEHSLSWRAVQWRITALRTGRSFAEVVLLNTLLYRVEQVFLIARDSGLLLQHVKSSAVTGSDADMVSGMLTAIRDFARDSFSVSEHEGLDALTVGDLSVWIEQGPHAIVAAVVRGNAPPELRVRLQEAVEHVHARMGDTLAEFSGDTQPFEVVRPTLEGLLEAQFRTEKRKRSPLLWILPVAGILAALVWAWFSWSQRSRWQDYLEALRAQPGIVVVSTDRQDGGFVVNGLRDPLAVDPASLLAAAGLASTQVRGNWQLYQALDPQFVQLRARELLRVPQGVTLAFDNGVLRATGSAPVEWIRESSRLAGFVPGVVRYDMGALLDGSVQALADDISRDLVLFARGSTAFEAGGDQVLAAQLERIRTLDALAQISDRRYAIQVVGHADNDGTPQVNDSLSVSRADLVRAAIEGLRPQRLTVSAAGHGSREPLTQNTSEADKRANRRVSIRIAPAQ